MIFYDIRIVEEISCNERTIVSWYDIAQKKFSFGIFNFTDQPNVMSKLSVESHWGWTVYLSEPMENPTEASEVFSLFLKDILEENYWFEDDSNYLIPDEFKHLVVEKPVDKPDEVRHNRPKFTLIKNED